jgi:hypothetical protein
MRVLGCFFILFLSSCSSKLRNIKLNPAPVKNEFNSIDSNSDLTISPDEYNFYKQAEYNSIDPIGWFFIIFGLVFLFSVVLGYFVKSK